MHIHKKLKEYSNLFSSLVRTRYPSRDVHDTLAAFPIRNDDPTEVLSKTIFSFSVIS